VGGQEKNLLKNRPGSREKLVLIEEGEKITGELGRTLITKEGKKREIKTLRR